MDRVVIPEGHKWRMDVTEGWEYCTCLNRCGWVRELLSMRPDKYTYTRGGLVLKFEPLCDPEVVCP